MATDLEHRGGQHVHTAPAVASRGKQYPLSPWLTAASDAATRGTLSYLELSVITMATAADHSRAAAIRPLVRPARQAAGGPDLTSGPSAGSRRSSRPAHQMKVLARQRRGLARNLAPHTPAGSTGALSLRAPRTRAQSCGLSCGSFCGLARVVTIQAYGHG